MKIKLEDVIDCIGKAKENGIHFNVNKFYEELNKLSPNFFDFFKDYAEKYMAFEYRDVVNAFNKLDK
jgi:NAD-dependent oxidoreductase involved in siderophore biosynthesis